jgi:hypothetical protein
MAGMAAGNELYNMLERKYDNERQKATKKDKPMKKKTEKKSSALAFGEKCAAGFDMNNSMLRTGLGGAALGAVGGGLAGLMAPGRDEEGRRRNRFGAALRGALGGGAVGGLGGVALEASMPGAGNDVEQYVRGLLARQNQTKQRPKFGPMAYAGVPLPGDTRPTTEPNYGDMRDLIYSGRVSDEPQRAYMTPIGSPTGQTDGIMA